MPDLAGIVLAAGEGTRLRPLTELRPKPLCPVGELPLIDHAFNRLADLTDAHAANLFHHAEMLGRYIGDRAHTVVEAPESLGTAGGVANLKPWIDGRDVVVTNADQYLPGGLKGFAEGWDGERCRLLCVPNGKRDFTTDDGVEVGYIGACLLPWSLVKNLTTDITGLYEVLWRDELAAGRLDLFVLPGDTVAIDCGTPADYLAANLHASGGASVIGAGATVLGEVTQSVVWPGAYVGPDEKLFRQIRVGSREQVVTVAA
ncbi:nucleotidyltransferase family protein [Kineosporia succinea]|uniref:Nucleotidyl transferase domain-containing protein n=1 Tax=Kineosporia succinea TaxID=84632 RepID=A0ABT9P3K1_9ACTN|nr:sugar phosphate nucleotidyltransferase [Kineosporia succinea]MDP9827258.1 hypothetical protein [Kineosporia succinea]